MRPALIVSTPKASLHNDAERFSQCSMPSYKVRIFTTRSPVQSPVQVLSHPYLSMSMAESMEEETGAPAAKRTRQNVERKNDIQPTVLSIKGKRHVLASLGYTCTACLKHLSHSS